MAALLVAMAVMAIVLSAAIPTWSHMVRREKEEELIFRGNQYARAINQYQRKFANASPASLDVLIEQHMLRKKWKDPLGIDKEREFQMLYLSSGMGSRGGAPPTFNTSAGRATAPGQGRAGSAAQPSGTAGGTTYSTTPSGGIVGVVSKNTGQSIKVYKQKQRYNEWQFIGMEQSQQAGGPGGAAGPQRGCPDGSPGRSVTRGGSTFTDCRSTGSGLQNRGGSGGFGGREGGRGGDRGGGFDRSGPPRGRGF